MKLKNLHIGARLGAGFGLVLILLVVLATVSLSRMSSIHESLEKITNESNQVIKELNGMRESVLRSAVAVRNMAVMVDEEAVKADAKQLEAAQERYKASAAAVDKLITDAASRALLDKIAAGEAATAPGMARAAEMAHRQGDVIPILISDVLPHQAVWLSAIDELIGQQEQAARTLADDTTGIYNAARLLTLALAAAALVLGAGVAVLVTRSIVNPLRGAVEVAQRVAKGDLTARVEVDSNDETGQLLAALRDMNTSLQRIVGQVRSGTDTITSASQEIASGNMDLSSRTEEQVSSLQMTASSMEELTSTVKHNADNASQASQLAATASEVATRGGTVVAEVVQTMGSINDSSKKIVDIIGVIDGIAFQTNILALNAAVEAARAGEQGRGFAVVASEVRNLAQRSAAAAKEIKTLIDDSVEKVDAGAKLVDQAGATMDEVVNSVRRVTDIIGEIAAASREQTAGIEQINTAIMQMDSTTQQNAALVEEAAAAAASLQEQAAQLSSVVSVFRLEQEERQPALATVAAPRPAEPAQEKTPPAPPPARRNEPRLPPAMKAGTDLADWEEF